jgi:hypothetical protein
MSQPEPVRRSILPPDALRATIYRTLNSSPDFMGGCPGVVTDQLINAIAAAQPVRPDTARETDATDARTRIIDALREIAPGHPTGRIWGRLQGATPDQAQEGNAWAGELGDVADIVLAALAQPDSSPEAGQPDGGDR